MVIFHSYVSYVSLPEGTYIHTGGFLKWMIPKKQNYGFQNVSILTWPNDLDALGPFGVAIF